MRLEELQNKKLILDYYLEPVDKSITALANFLSQNSKDIDERVLKLATDLNAKFTLPEDNKYFLALKSSLPKFLYPRAIEDYVGFAKENNFKNFLSTQLFYLNLIINSNDKLAPYDLNEIKNLLAGTMDYYSDEALLITLRDILFNDSDENNEKINLLANWLPEIVLGELGEDRYDWIEALVFTVLLHTAWSKFPVLSEKNKKRLLGSYLYLGSVGGVNLKLVFENFNFSFDKPSDHFSIGEEVLNNKETIDISQLETARFSDLIQFYFQKGTDGYSKEEYLNSLYKDSNLPNKNIYIAWLRTAINSLTAITF